MDRKISDQDSNDEISREMFNFPPQSYLESFGPLRMAITIFAVLGVACAGLAAINFFVAG